MINIQRVNFFHAKSKMHQKRQNTGVVSTYLTVKEAHLHVDVTNALPRRNLRICKILKTY